MAGPSARTSSSSPESPRATLHAAGLIEELVKAVPGIRISGLGGPRMEKAGMRLDADLASDAIMGIFPVIKALPRIRRMMALAKRKLEEERPDALVLVDYPGFNMRLAQAAKDLGIPVIYYISPQVWAWGAQSRREARAPRRPDARDPAVRGADLRGTRI